MTKHTCLFLGLCLLNFALLAQRMSPLSIDVLENGQNLEFPFLGGLNSPQFNEVDLNEDGILDLLVFDRSGDVLLSFLNGGTAGVVDYEYSPDYARNFPLVRYWIVLRDFDGDGVMDLFTESLVPFTLGVQVYKGKYQDGELRFDPFLTSEGVHPELLYFQEAGGGFEEIFVDAADYPAIDDLDGDGDLDILTFKRAGGVIEWYKNVSVENGFGKDSLQFVLEDECYGGVFELELDDCPRLSSGPGECAQFWEPPTAETRNIHPGSTLFTLDIDDDQDKDLILGDLNFNNLVMLTNCNTATQPWFCEADCDFPDYDVPYLNPEFPAAFWLDVNNDNKKDLLVSPNTPNRSENRENVWYYENTGSNEIPVFTLRRRNFLVGEMIDLGNVSAPAIADIDADGLLDIIVGNESFFLPNAERDPKLFWYKNIGTSTQPRFLLEDSDWLRFSEITDANDFALTPSFGDLDADGDLDLLVGEVGGSLFYAENMGGAGNPMQFITIEKEWLGIDVGASSTPHLVDLNRDGKMDLLIGERIQQLPDFQQVGNINYFENQGSPTNPVFNSNPTNSFLGEVNTKDVNTLYSGLSAPFVIEVDGKYRLLTGTGDGRMMVYDDIDGNLNGRFSLVSESYDNFLFGSKSRPAIADLNNDGQLDLLMGNDRGGLMAFVTDLNDFFVGTSRPDFFRSVQLSPNPASEIVQISGLPEGDVKFHIYDVVGKKMDFNVLSQDLVSVVNLPPGLYLLEIMHEQGRGVKRLVIAR